MTVVRRCEQCAHAAVIVEDDGPLYQCRRYPPTPVTIDGEPGAGFVEVAADDWCGEFSPGD